MIDSTIAVAARRPSSATKGIGYARHTRCRAWASRLFDELLREVQQMHGSMRSGPRQFDAKVAVTLFP